MNGDAPEEKMVSVLLVDDESVLLEVTKEYLMKRGRLEIDTAQSAQEAILMLHSHNYEVIISDYEMPEMNGLEFLRYLRDSGYLIPFILFTGRGREDVVIDAFHNGATFYLQKGGEPRSVFTELSTKIARAAEQYRSRQKVEHLYHILQALRTISDTIHQETDLRSLLGNICRIIIQNRGYNNVRIVLFGKNGDISTAYQDGLGEHFEELITYLKAGNLTACTKRALQNGGEPVLCQPTLTCEKCPLYSAHIGNYALTRRLECRNEIFGIISVTLTGSLALDRDEQLLFDEVSREIAYAIYHNALEEEQNAINTLISTNKKLQIINTITRHDIRNQLTAQVAYYEMLEELSPKYPEIREYVQGIGNAITNIQSHLLFSDVYQKIGIQRPRWLSISSIIENTIQSHSFDGIAILYSTGTLEVYTDPMFGKIITNLIDNAIHHGETVTSIQIHFEEHLDQGILVVEDNGRGIPDENKSKIFERGFGTRSGLGLYIIREILSITGMNISETGFFGNGARFEISVPKSGYRMKKGNVDGYAEPGMVRE